MAESEIVQTCEARHVMLSSTASLPNPVETTFPLTLAMMAPAATAIVRAHHNATSFEEVIRQRAYLKWVAQGMPSGDGVLFWLDAETELLQGT